ncbi:hypothetical protein [Spirosoma pulveris]
MANTILLSKDEDVECPQTQREINEAVQRFRNSILAEYTYQYRRGDLNLQMGFDFPIEKMLALINNPECEKIRILFTVDGGDAEGDGFLSVVLFGLGANRQPLFDNVTFECCGEPPTET